MSAKGTAVITGAGSGIGRALSHLCAQRGYDLALFDIRGDDLEETAREAAKSSVKITTRVVDVADERAVEQGAAEVIAEHGPITLLLNNAGVALGGQFDQASTDDFRWLVEINLFGVVSMTRAFMPALKAAPHAQIVNISSVFGIISPPGQTAYCASKFAVRGFSESLRHELQGTSVGVSVVHPGGVSTNIAKRARMSDGITEEEQELAQQNAAKSLVMPPPKAAQIIVDGAERGAKRILVGNDARLIVLIQRLFPVSYWTVLSRLFGREGITTANQSD
ncbi:MAG: SDR family NAD(P)-dependent oxidoreductase [Pseudomonadota bacterium]